MQYWLLKNEPECYSIKDLKNDKTTDWTGVRNYQARNFMCDMKVGDKALFYHSKAGDETGVVGEMKVSRPAFPDPTQFDKKSEYYDSKATKAEPRWWCVEVKYVSELPRLVSLKELKNDPTFSNMTVVKKGNRLSIMPVSKEHYDSIVSLSKE